MQILWLCRIAPLHDHSIVIGLVETTAGSNSSCLKKIGYELRQNQDSAKFSCWTIKVTLKKMKYMVWYFCFSDLNWNRGLHSNFSSKDCSTLILQLFFGWSPLLLRRLKNLSKECSLLHQKDLFSMFVLKYLYFFRNG